MMHDELDRSEGVPWKKIAPASWNVAAFFHSPRVIALQWVKVRISGQDSC